ncbi:MAG: DNA polymerase III subunit alpha [Gammaproteobacteria bacterium]|nr:DNA polymerase III subunit alpha [Gammaproteobacteria bacterium]
MPAQFVHLHVHSEYSLVDGLAEIKALARHAAQAGMGALAVTDQSNLFAMVRFYKAASAAGVKPVIGVDAWVRNPGDATRPDRVVILVQDQTGYHNLTRLVSRSYRENQHYGRALLERDWLLQASQGLILLSGAREGDVGRALLSGHRREAEESLDAWLAAYGDRYYLELVRTGRAGEEDYLHEALSLAARRGVPVVATNDVRFLSPDDFQAHEVRVCIHEGRTLDDPRRSRQYTEQQYLRSAQEMAELFADVPEALDNSLEIARRCNLELSLGKYFLPAFPVPTGMTVDDYFREQAREGLEWRLRQQFDPGAPAFPERQAHYRERLETELSVIVKMGFTGYFLIVADFIQWAKSAGIPVGPGRGSGAGSLVAYALKITDLDPIEHDLLFERFLNPERVSMPDFDIDFCMEGRDRVIDYVAHKYGRDSVSQIITYGSMAAKAVVRDVGRVLGHPYGFVDKIAKLVPFELGITLDKALQESDELRERYEQEEEVRELIEMARKLEGLARNAGKHAGGVVIAPGELTDFTPLYCEPGGENLVTQLDKDDVEQIGLVKFDFLGLRTLTIIDWALKTVNEGRQAAGLPPVDIARIPMDDPDAFALLKRCETAAVFQLESRGMRELVRKLQPDRFDDITALVALFRPGPLQSGMVDDFVARKHGRLKPTYGVILYQEQVMQIAQVLAGYTLGGADLLRRAMGKKKPEEMAKQREIFQRGAVERGVDADVAAHIFDLMEKFAGYGFNKSHSAAYALVAYQTAWLKAHYPAEFMAAVLSADMDNTDKVVPLIEECRAMRLAVQPPRVNGSEFRFTVADGRTVVYGLGAIKGVGESAIEGILEARRRDGPFADLVDLCRRIDLRRVNRRVLESLVKAGALDQLGAGRAALMAQLPLALKLAEQHHETAAAGQGDLFGMGEPAAPPPAEVLGAVEGVAEWDDAARLAGEKETLGLYLTGHPIDRYVPEITALGLSRIADVVDQTGPPEPGEWRRGPAQRVAVVGLVVAISKRQTQRGPMASVLLDDRSGRIEAAFFTEALEQHRDLLAVDKVLWIEGLPAYDDFRNSASIRADRAQDFEQARAGLAGSLRLRAESPRVGRGQLSAEGVVATLAQILEPFRGGTCAVYVDLQSGVAHGVVALGWRVDPRDELLRRLERFLGPDSVTVCYAAAKTAVRKVPGTG